MQVPENAIDLRCFSTWPGEQGIHRTRVKPAAEIVIEDAKANSEAVNSFELEKYPLIVDTSQIKSITKEARDQFSMRGRESSVVAIAMIIKSPLSKIVGNFFMGLNKPRVPVRLFNDEESAKSWCKDFVN